MKSVGAVENPMRRGIKSVWRTLQTKGERMDNIFSPCFFCGVIQESNAVRFFGEFRIGSVSNQK